MPPTRAWGTVWITGASSGIGRTLAVRLAQGGALVAVSARSAAALQDLERLSENIRAFPLDVTDGAATAAVVASIERDVGAIDLAILNAGIFRPMTASRYDLAQAKASMAVNYEGVIHALAPMMETMIGRGRGHIAMVASVAGYRGLPNSAAYAPTKAALISLAECLREDLNRKGVDISVINPGFVATPMTAQNRFPMPFIVGEDYAAQAIERGLRRRRFEIAFPLPTVFMTKTLRVLPYPIFFWLTRLMARWS